MTTRTKTINAIATEMRRIIEKQGFGKATQKELIDLAILTEALRALNANT